ncbi:hypothetical protein HYR99_15175 [Candidatus Poribacteria bacterium]|nr:hypothetical protein [Candidatus Poribacteria bacterium]
MRKRGQFYVVCIVWCLVFLSLVACRTVIEPTINPVISDLRQAKEHWKQGDYAWNAAQEISCTESQEGCNQLHLIKGDACFRLAKQAEAENKKPEARAHYECAVTHLEIGIQQTTNWQLGELDLNRPQTYENLCEALRNWQDMERGDTANQITQRLLKTAQDFRTAEPGNLGAIYFLNSARFTLLRRELLQPRDTRALCEKLNEIIQALDEGVPRVGGTRYEANYHRLRLDVEGAKQTVPGCQ